MEISNLVKLQREYFYTNETLDISYRRAALNRLREAINKYEKELIEALKLDLGKHELESFMTEIGIVLREITFMEKNIKKLMRRKVKRTSLSDFPARSYRYPFPYGVVLVMSPWNYPMYLTLAPLVGAIASGNTCILKPSEYSKYTSDVIDKMIKEFFDEKYIAVVTGGIEENQTLLDQKFDYIFFTGGKVVGRIVMQKASKNLTPISLELGGKSPCIVDETANLKVAAKRVAFGKYLNAGQTCVAPDYLYIHENVKEEFLKHFKQAVLDTFGMNPIESENLGKIINKKHFDRLSSLLVDQNIILGADKDAKKLKIAPTIIDDITHDNIIMEDEIFGPILPVLTYKNLDEVIKYVNSQPNPLALYMFTTSLETERKILGNCNFGGGCINDTIVHVASETLPFGGVGESGMGNYHGDASFKTFSHYRSIIKKGTWLDLPFRYAPYTKLREKVIKKFLR